MAAPMSPPPFRLPLSLSHQDRQDLIARLTWQYGRERASLIVQAQDRGTSADLTAWRRLGEGRA